MMQDGFLNEKKKSITATSRSNFLLALTEATVDRGGSRAGIELARSEWLRLRGEQATSNQCLLSIEEAPKHQSVTLCLSSTRRNTNNGRGWSESERAGREREGDGDGRELDRIFERNMATHVSTQRQTSARCKNNLSNYEERRRAFLSGMFYCTPPLYTSPVYI